MRDLKEQREGDTGGSSKDQWTEASVTGLNEVWACADTKEGAAHIRFTLLESEHLRMRVIQKVNYA